MPNDVEEAGENGGASSGPIPPNAVRFHYIKSNLFRIVCCDGAWGGPTPGGYLLMNFFSERQPIPTEVVYEIDTGGRLGNEIRSSRKARDGFVREVEVGVEMDLKTAKALRVWLDDKIAAMEKKHELL